MTDTPTKGHNYVAGIAGERLLSYVERIERLNEAEADIKADKADVFKEARAEGYDVKALRALIRERAKDPHEVAEFEELLDLYRSAVSSGMSVATRGRAKED